MQQLPSSPQRDKPMCREMLPFSVTKRVLASDDVTQHCFQGLRAHVEDAAAKGLPHADWLARTLQQGDNADAAQVGAFLSRLLTGGTGHAFMSREWSVNHHTLRDNPDPWG